MASRSKWIRINRPFYLPPEVKTILQSLSEAGHVAYIAGGSVRDFLLERPTKDYDIATSAKPDEVCALFPDSITVGKSFGVIKIPYSKIPGAQVDENTSNDSIEVATFREEGKYVDHRHPTSVRFTGPEQDASRRDFTINGLFYDPKSHRILDCVEGVEDLKAGIVRAIGEPHHRFQEDALRLLRALRFAVRFGFALDPQTAQAVRSKALLIKKISAERIRDELNFILCGPSPEVAIQMLSEFGLLSLLIPEIEALKGIPQIPARTQGETVWDHTLRTLRMLSAFYPKRSMSLSWAVLLHEVGKPIVSIKTGEKNFNAHEQEGADLAARVLDRLKCPRIVIDRVKMIILEHLKFKDVFQMREATLQRWIRQDYFGELLKFHHVDAMAIDGNVAYFDFSISKLKELSNLQSLEGYKLVDGTDLIQLGFEPGPKFTQILKTVEDLALEGKLETKEQALEYVVQFFVK